MNYRIPALVAGLVLITLPGAALHAQAIAPRLPQVKKACSMLASVISVKVVNRAGKPVPDAKVRLTRLRDGKSLGLAHEMAGGSGEFEIVEPAAKSWILPKGERIRVDARAGSRSARGVVRVGQDSAGCRLVRLSGPDVLTLR